MSYLRIKLSEHGQYIRIWGDGKWDDDPSWRGGPNYIGSARKRTDGRWSFRGFVDPPPFATLDVLLSWAQDRWNNYKKENGDEPIGIFGL